MTTRPIGALLLGAALIALVGAPASAQDEAKKDTIVLSDGGDRADVEVQSADFEKVVYKNGGRESTQPGHTVAEVRWGDAPREYAPGWRALKSGDGDSARLQFEACIDAKEALSLRDWVDEYANVGLGEAHLVLAARDEEHLAKATAAFGKALAANAKSLMLDRIRAGLAEAALAAGSLPEAQKQAGALVKAGKDARRPGWELKGLFLKARAEEAADSVAGAGKAYEDIMRLAQSEMGNAKSDSLKAELASARLTAAARKGWLLVAKAEKSGSAADFDAARSYFNGLSSTFGKEPEILAAASNALGVVKLANDDTYAALYDFQRTEVVYFAVPSEVARSLYYQALCWEKLGNDKQRSARAKDLKQYYPKSEWARKLK